VAADPIGHLGDRSPTRDLRDHAISSMHAYSQRAVPHLAVLRISAIVITQIGRS